MKGLLFTYVMTYGGAGVALFNPFVGLLIYICFAIIKPEALWGFSLPQGGGNYSRIVAIAVLAGWAIKGFGNWEFGKAGLIVASLVGFFAWTAISASQAIYQDEAWHFVEELLKIVLPFIVGISTIDSMKQVKQLTWVMMVSHGYLALEFNISYYQGFNIIKEVGFAGMEEGSVAITMVTSVGLAFFLAFVSERWWQKAIAWACTALLIHVVLFSFSRGGMLALIAVGIVSFFLVPKKPFHYVMLVLMVMLTLQLAGKEVRARFATSFASESERDESAQGRLVLWSNCWDSMLTHPLFGIGPNNFPLIAARYSWQTGKEGHTLWLQMGAEVGFPGLTLLLLFYGTSVRRLWPWARDKMACPDPWCASVARMVIASLMGFFVAALFISLRGLETPYYITLLGASVLKLTSTGRVVAATPPTEDIGLPPLILSSV